MSLAQNVIHISSKADFVKKLTGFKFGAINS